jgi:hypothetical protein
MDLKAVVSSIYSVLAQDKPNVYVAYQTVPINERQDVYAVVDVEKISLENQFVNTSHKDFKTTLELRARVLAKPHRSIYSLYEIVDTTIISRLINAGYHLIRADIGTPELDKNLNRMALEGKFLLMGKSEVNQ